MASNDWRQQRGNSSTALSSSNSLCKQQLSTLPSITSSRFRVDPLRQIAKVGRVGQSLNRRHLKLADIRDRIAKDEALLSQIDSQIDHLKEEVLEPLRAQLKERRLKYRDAAETMRSQQEQLSSLVGGEKSSLQRIQRQIQQASKRHASQALCIARGYSTLPLQHAQGASPKSQMFTTVVPSSKPQATRRVRET